MPLVRPEAEKEALVGRGFVIMCWRRNAKEPGDVGLEKENLVGVTVLNLWKFKGCYAKERADLILVALQGRVRPMDGYCMQIDSSSIGYTCDSYWKVDY